MAMLCCVSRKAASGTDDVVGGARSRASVELSRFVEVCKDLSKAQTLNRQENENEVFKRLDEAVLDVAAVASSFSSFQRLETLPEEAYDSYNDAQPEVLHPCAVCGRKFNSRSLEKHVKICERTATKKRKPFDSAKQRIKGTELAEFLPKQTSTHQSQSYHTTTTESRRPSGSYANSGIGVGGGHGTQNRSHQWKQTRDEFLRAIRAARGDTQPTSRSHHSSSHAQSHSSQVSSSSSSPAAVQRPSTLSLVKASGAPTRSNEKGQCPTCQRQFGLKSYDRHVAFCRERATRLPASPQNRDNVAKERLEARMKYRAPSLRNRKPTNREKYSPGAHKVAPLLAKSPMKDSNASLNSTTTTTNMTTSKTTAAATAAKNSETVSPKLPMLNKRSNQTTKESPAATSGPLKSRPMDRSNRMSDSQESLNPSPIRQLFTSRRLQLLTDTLPSKILQPTKPSVLSNSSQKSSARLVSQFLKKAFGNSSADGNAQNAEKAEKKVKKNIKQKYRSHREVEFTEEQVKESKSALKYEGVEGDFITWKQIREDVRKNSELETIDREEEPVLSDVTGLSSYDEGNSTTDEFEFNEQMLLHQERNDCIAKKDFVEKISLGPESQQNNSSLNEAYVVDEAIKEDKLPVENFQAHSCEKNNNKENENCDSDDEDGLSSASTKTFKKSDRCIDFVDSLDSCLYQRKVDMIESNEYKIGNHSDTETLKSFEIHEADSKNEGKHEESIVSTMSKERSQLPPIKCYSMPNIRNEPKETYELRTKNVRKEEEETIGKTITFFIRKYSYWKLKKYKTSIKAEQQESVTRGSSLRVDGSRCATYVIEKSSNSSHYRQQHGVSSDSTYESSEEKPLKKRRKLQQQQPYMQQAFETEEDEDESLVPEKDARLHRRLKNSESDENKTTKPRKQYDYYRNETANFSDISSVRTDDVQVTEFEEDFGDETESNASELLKEIDVSLIDSELRNSYGAFIAGSQDSLLDLVKRMRSVELTNNRPRSSEIKTGRIGSTRLDDYIKRSDELPTELTDLSSKKHADKSVQLYEKEICTITRLDSLGRDDNFLPCIDSRAITERCDWKEKMEYHRKKLSRQSHRGFETPREGDEDNEKLPRVRMCSSVRRHFQSEMRSGASKDYDPFLLAEQQLNDLFSDTSDQSSNDGSSICPPQKPNSSPNFPLSHGSAFVKYPNTNPKAQSTPEAPTQPPSDRQAQQRRLSVIAPPTGFDDLTSSDLSSDCTETNSLSRDFFTSSAISTPLQNSRFHSNNPEQRELGRRLIIDQNQALGGGEFAPPCDTASNQTKLQNGSRSIRPAVPARSNSLRSAAPKVPERKLSSSSSSGSSDFARTATAKSCGNGKPGSSSSPSYKQPASASQQQQQQQRTANGCKTLATDSSLSLSSIISDAETKRSNSLFDELLSSFEEDPVDSSSTLPSLMSLMRNDTSLSLLSSSTTQQSPQPSSQQQQQQQQQQQNGAKVVNGHHSRIATNGRIDCNDDDAELSSPESLKRQECGKLSADSAYSSLNRKYSTHGRSTNDVSCKYKLSKFCHECGFKFPDSAKFCCECGVKRLTL